MEFTSCSTCGRPSAAFAEPTVVAAAGAAATLALRGFTSSFSSKGGTEVPKHPRQLRRTTSAVDLPDTLCRTDCRAVIPSSARMKPIASLVAPFDSLVRAAMPTSAHAPHWRLRPA